MSRVLVIGDIHNPVAHPGYLSFCQDLYAKYKCDRVVFIGDIVDWSAITFHARHPEAPGAKDEYQLAYACIQQWYNVFPKADCCIGNHDERVVRVAEDAGIPSFLIRHYKEIWNTPGWNWVDQVTIDDVYYFHGTNTGGLHPSFNTMGKMLMSVVQGHIHSAAGIKWRANPLRRIFGMDTGCGIDDKAIAFAYGKHQKIRSILGAGVVLNGVPYHEIMPIGEGEKYHRSRFKEKGFYGHKLSRASMQRLDHLIQHNATGGLPEQPDDESVVPSSNPADSGKLRKKPRRARISVRAGRGRGNHANGARAK